MQSDVEKLVKEAANEMNFQFPHKRIVGTHRERKYRFNLLSGEVWVRKIEV